MVLNEATNYMVGDLQVDKIMHGDIEVWSDLPPVTFVDIVKLHTYDIFLIDRTTGMYIAKGGEKLYFGGDC